MHTALRPRHLRTSPALLALFAMASAAPACDFNEGKFSGEFNAGGADPYNFPAPYRGAGASRQTPGAGVFTEVAGYASGKKLGYYSFPFSPSQVQTTNYAVPSAGAWPDGVIDPLRVSGPGTDFRKTANNPVPVPLVYNFDPPGGSNPFAASQACRAPDGYTFDRFTEAFPQNEQWNVFTFLPDRFTSWPFGSLTTWSYRPVVAEVAVTTGNLGCQSIKSERALLASADQNQVSLERGEPEPDGTRLGEPSPGRFLAWALIDPGSAVVRVGEVPDVLSGGHVTGTSVQKYGWYGQFIVAYIDGGYIPVEDGPTVATLPTQRMRPQRLYYPRSDIIRTGATAATAGALGQGYDVLQANRFEDGERYSPVCEVWTYALPAATKVSDLPKDEATIVSLANATLEPARAPQVASSYTPSPTVVPRYVFCLQAAPLPAP